MRLARRSCPQTPVPATWAEMAAADAAATAAWASTVPAPARSAWSRRVFRPHPPSAEELRQLSGLLAALPRTDAPARWLRGGEYAAVAFRHPADASLYVVAAGGLVGVGAGEDFTPGRWTAVFFADPQRLVETTVRELLSTDPDSRRLLEQLWA